MEGPNWEQLLRNGQLVEAEPTHRVMLERFYSFFKGTADEQIFSQKYPKFYKEMISLESTNVVETPVNVTPVDSEPIQSGDEVVGEVPEEIIVEAPKKRKGRKAKSSPTPDAE